MSNSHYVEIRVYRMASRFVKTFERIMGEKGLFIATRKDIGDDENSKSYIWQAVASVSSIERATIQTFLTKALKDQFPKAFIETDWQDIDSLSSWTQSFDNAEAINKVEETVEEDEEEEDSNDDTEEEETELENRVFWILNEKSICNECISVREARTLVPEEEGQEFSCGRCDNHFMSVEPEADRTKEVAVVNSQDVCVSCMSLDERLGDFSHYHANGLHRCVRCHELVQATGSPEYDMQQIKVVEGDNVCRTCTTDVEDRQCDYNTGDELAYCKRCETIYEVDQDPPEPESEMFYVIESEDITKTLCVDCISSKEENDDSTTRVDSGESCACSACGRTFEAS